MAEKDLDELLSEVEAIRDRLADSIDDLNAYIQPSAVASRGAQGIKAQFVNEDGSVRLDRVVPLVIGAVVLVGLGKLGRSLFSD